MAAAAAFVHVRGGCGALRGTQGEGFEHVLGGSHRELSRARDKDATLGVLTDL